jgi:carboxylesterase type B
VERPAPGDPIAIDGGRVDGKLLASGVKAYFGIPFAAPPVREFRWRDPQPVQPWSGVRHADRFAPECVQTLRAHDINHYFGEEATSEDCLYLNVWVPPDATSTARRPVAVWIYGGGFTIGSAAMANYQGESLARKGLVYVTISYRVGALGFWRIQRSQPNRRITLPVIRDFSIRSPRSSGCKEISSAWAVIRATSRSSASRRARCRSLCCSRVRWRRGFFSTSSA